MNERCLIKAAQMLNTGDGKPEVARLHCDLARDLKRIDELCRNLKGELVSRQVIANAIVDWIQRNPDKTPYYARRGLKGVLWQTKRSKRTVTKPSPPILE